MQTPEFKPVMDEYIYSIEKQLTSYFETDSRLPARLADAMQYSLLSGGKRVRGVLTLAFYSLFSGAQEVVPALHFAAAVEMIHAYSLIHDDLPCMDDDDMRRGKPSCHIAFGETTALLAGDALLTLSFEVLAKAPLAPEKIVRALSVLAKSAGMRGMVAGQVMDLDGEGKQLTTMELDRINKSKTGALISAAALLGAIAADAQEEGLMAAQGYAMNIGRAFQIMDDVLDVTADQTLLGKPVGSDVDNRKNTYAALLGIDACKREITVLTQGAIDIIRTTDRDTSFLEQFASFLAGRMF